MSKRFGWAGSNEALVRSEFRLLSRAGYFRNFRIVSESGRVRSTTGKRMMLYLLARQVLGQDIPFYPQQTDDCGGFAAKNAVEYCQVSQKAIQGESLKWRPVHPSYLYGASRCYVGRNQLGRQGGTLVSWLTVALQRYGSLFADEQGAPRYSGAVSDAFGDTDPRNDLDLFLPRAKNYLVGTAARITTWNQFVAALCNGNPVMCGSEVGFETQARADGFHYRGREPWPHAMCFIGVDDEWERPYAVLQNQWEIDFGQLLDFRDGHKLPKGCLRIERQSVEAILAARESFAVSSFAAFIDASARLERKMFDLIGR